MTDLEAFRYAPAAYLIMVPLSIGFTLLVGASWKFGIRLTLVMGTIVWFVTVARESRERGRQ